MSSSSVGQRQCHDSAVEKIIHMPGGWTRVTGDRRRIGAVDLLVALAGDEKSDTGAEDDVFDEQRAPLKAEAAIEAEGVARVIGEKHLFGNGGADGPNVFHVHECFELWCHVGVESISNDGCAGINEVGLSFRFTGAEIGHETVALLKVHGRAGKIEALVHIKAERTAEGERAVENRVEAGGVRVAR